jgi:hypothetical protein
MEKWCCPALQEYFSRRDSRGFVIFAEPPNPPVTTEPTFWFAVQAVDRDDLPRLPKPPDGCSLRIMLQTWGRVFFCPWCGRKLERYYRNRWQQLYDEKISKDHDWVRRD